MSTQPAFPDCCHNQIGGFEDERRARPALVLDGGADRRDLGRGRPATAADHLRAEIARVGGELGEVLRRRVRIDDAAAGEAGETDVGERGQRLAVVAHVLQRRERRQQPRTVILADGGHVELR